MLRKRWSRAAREGRALQGLWALRYWSSEERRGLLAVRARKQRVDALGGERVVDGEHARSQERCVSA